MGESLKLKWQKLLKQSKKLYMQQCLHSLKKGNKHHNYSNALQSITLQNTCINFGIKRTE